MTRKILIFASIFLGIISLITAGIIFEHAEGFRRIYSTLFFVIIGAVLMLNGIRWKQELEDS